MRYQREARLNPLHRGLYHGGYHVPLPGRAAVVRPNKTAAGMSYTAARSARYRPRLLPRASNPDGLADDALRLVVKGTLDAARGLGFSVERVACPCCGATQRGKLRLNDRGKLRLRTARARAQTDEAKRAPFRQWSALFPDCSGDGAAIRL